MYEFKVIVSKVQHPLGLPSIELLCLFEECEVFMVSEDLYLEWGPLQVVAPGLEATNNGKKFGGIGEAEDGFG